MGRKEITINPECGKRLQYLLITNGISQISLAKKLYVHQQHISNIVNGRRRLTPDFAEKIISEFFTNIRVEWLLCKDDFKTEDEKDIFRKQKFEKIRMAALYEEKTFRHYIDRIAEINGYGFDSARVDVFDKDVVLVTDSNGEKIGFIDIETFNNIKNQIDAFSSYLVHCAIKNEMNILPGKGDMPQWLTYKKDETKKEN